jgi:integral membrane protein (TIGR00529 family)
MRHVEMLNPSVALLASIAGILILIRLKVRPGLAIFAGSLTISLLLLPLRSLPEHMFHTLVDRETLTLLAVVASALALSRLMEVKGLLTSLAATMERLGPRLAMHLVPATIGLVPMPAGALVSATALRDLGTRIGLTPERVTFINYWFRHIWEASLPVYPAVIATSVILSVQLSSVTLTLLPMTALVAALGTISSYRMLKPKRRHAEEERTSKGSIVRNLLRTSWPILLIVGLVLVGLDAVIAFPLTLALLACQQRAKWPELKIALKYGADVQILFLLYAVMLFKATIEAAGAAYTLFSDMQHIGMPTSVLLVFFPFLIGFATGISMGFVGISLPLLVPFMILGSQVNSYALILAYISGYVGVLLSPLHLCLILSTQYFKASFAKVYKLILPPLLAIEAVVVFIYYIAA